MKRIFTPWRMKYIKSNKQGDGCIFCSVIEQNNDETNYLIHRGKYAFVILNKYPYTSGHLMVVPYQHSEILSDLNKLTRSEMMELVNKASHIVKEVYEPEGFNIGINMGSAAGAGIADHIHIHVVPRWFGDTNFIPVIGDTRLIPEELDVTYKHIKAAW